MARKSNITGPEVSVDHDLVARVKVFFDEVPKDRHWAHLLESEGPPPGGTEPVGAYGGEVTMHVDADKVGEALDWLNNAVEEATEQWEHDEARRTTAEDLAERALREWWTANG